MTSEQACGVHGVTLTSLFSESLFFGIFTVSYGLSLWVLFAKRDNKNSVRQRNIVLCVISTALYALCVVHLALSFKAALQGTPMDESVDPETAFLMRMKGPYSVAKLVVVATMSVVGDGFLTYRVFVIWNYNRKVIVLPFILYLATTAAAYALCGQLVTLSVDSAANRALLERWIAATLWLTLVGHLYSTVLIGARLAWANRRLRQSRMLVIGFSVWDVLETVIQSTLIHSVGLVILIGTLIARNSAMYVFLDVMAPITGATFSLLIIRVGLGYKTAADEVSSLPGPPRALAREREEFRIRPIEIAVSVAHTDSSDGVHEKIYACAGADTDSEMATPQLSRTATKEDACEIGMGTHYTSAL